MPDFTIYLPKNIFPNLPPPIRDYVVPVPPTAPTPMPPPISLPLVFAHFLPSPVPVSLWCGIEQSRGSWYHSSFFFKFNSQFA